MKSEIFYRSHNILRTPGTEEFAKLLVDDLVVAQQYDEFTAKYWHIFDFDNSGTLNFDECMFDSECNNKNEKLNRLIKLVKTKDKWDKEEYIELLEHLILQTDQVFDDQQPDIDKIANKIEILSTE